MSVGTWESAVLAAPGARMRVAALEQELLADHWGELCASKELGL